MGNFELSNYQKNILNYIRNEQGNLLVDAKAGAGKTSTLILIADEIIRQNKKCLFLAFNKSIVEELKTKIISDNCEIKTLHSLGLSFLRSYLYKKHGQNYDIEIDQNDECIKERVRKLFDEKCLENFKLANSELSDDDFKDLYYNVTREIANMVNYVRLYNINFHMQNLVEDLGERLCFELKKGEDIGVQGYYKIIEQIIDEIKIRFENPEKDEDSDKFIYKIGYTDMIYFPCLYQMNPPWSIRSYLDYVELDESQDLSVLQQKFVKLLITNHTRLIAVGDKNQSIYAFAGADTKSIDNLKRNFYLKELPLNVCYRCPEKVIKLSQTIVPEIDWNHKREDKGNVTFIDETELCDLLNPKDVILARRNKDLLTIYKYLVLDKKTSVKFKNRDTIKTIINEIDTVIKEYIRRYNTFNNVEKMIYENCNKAQIDWRHPKELSKQDKAYILNEFKKARSICRLDNKGRQICKSKYNLDYLMICMQDFKENGSYNYNYDGMLDPNLTEYYDIIDSMIDEYKKQGNISPLVKDFTKYLSEFLSGNMYEDAPILSSIHMMKGGEADNVFIIDYPRFPYIYSSQTEEAQQQERNLQYVALTRAKKNLYLSKISRLKNSRETEDDIEKLNVESQFKVDLALKKA